LLATPASALIFSDDFEAGVQGTVWTPWPPAHPAGINNLVTTDTGNNHTPGGAQSARVWESDPAAWNGYAEFGITATSIRADVYVYENLVVPGTNPAKPVSNMLALFGDHPSGPDGFSDYLQLGVVPFYPGGSQTYGYRTLYADTLAGQLAAVDTGVARKAGWTKLSIEADSLDVGGAVRFYIDDALVGGSFRAGANAGAGGLSPADLRWVRIGNNNKSYENFWYDDVEVVPQNGDFNGDGAVDAADYVVWRKNRGLPDGHQIWRANFGATPGLGSGYSQIVVATVPEPSTILTLFTAGLALAAVLCCRRGHGQHRALGEKLKACRQASMTTM
jgi:hypothetical protein